MSVAFGLDSLLVVHSFAVRAVTDAPFDVQMLAYSYYVIKRCELNGFARYKKHFRLLKNQAKIAQCDRWWKSICLELGWPFKPTV